MSEIVTTIKRPYNLYAGVWTIEVKKTSIVDGVEHCRIIKFPLKNDTTLNLLRNAYENINKKTVSLCDYVFPFEVEEFKKEIVNEESY